MVVFNAFDDPNVIAAGPVQFHFVIPLASDAFALVVLVGVLIVRVLIDPADTVGLVVSRMTVSVATGDTSPVAVLRN